MFEKQDYSETNKIFEIIVSQESDEKRAEKLGEYGQIINDLKKRFAELVDKNQEIAKKSGHSDYFDYKAEESGVKLQKLDDLLSRIEEYSPKIYETIPSYLKDQEWFGTIFNSLSFSGNGKYQIPKDVQKILSAELKVDKSILDQIVLVSSDSGISLTKMDHEQNKVVISYNPKHKDIGGVMTLAHEYGHALTYLEQFKDGKDPYKFSHYYQEKKAIDVEIKISKHLKDSSVYRAGALLRHFRDTYFEYLVYKNITSNFDEAFCLASKMVVPNLNCETNPLYVFNNFLFEYPCFSTIYTLIYLEILSSRSKRLF